MLNCKTKYSILNFLKQINAFRQEGQISSFFTDKVDCLNQVHVIGVRANQPQSVSVIWGHSVIITNSHKRSHERQKRNTFVTYFGARPTYNTVEYFVSNIVLFGVQCVMHCEQLWWGVTGLAQGVLQIVEYLSEISEISWRFPSNLDWISWALWLEFLGIMRRFLGKLWNNPGKYFYINF